MPEKPNPSAADVAKMHLQNLSFRYNTYGENKGWTAEATVTRSKDGYSGANSINLRLDNAIAEKLMLAIAPLVVMSASNAAQELADESKALANALSDSLQKSIAPEITV